MLTRARRRRTGSGQVVQRELQLPLVDYTRGNLTTFWRSQLEQLEAAGGDEIGKLDWAIESRPDMPRSVRSCFGGCGARRASCPGESMDGFR